MGCSGAPRPSHFSISAYTRARGTATAALGRSTTYSYREVAFVSTLRAQKVTELRDFVFLSLGVRDAVQSGAGCVNDACVGNYAPVYVLVEG